jgi:hypothetical protein
LTKIFLYLWQQHRHQQPLYTIEDPELDEIEAELGIK